VTLLRLGQRIARRNGLNYRDIRRPVRPVPPAIPVTERQFQDHVSNLAALYGWHGVHITRSKGVMEGIHSLARGFPRGSDHDDAHGLPDLILMHPVRFLLLLAELKIGRNQPTKDQQRWLLWGPPAGYAWRTVCWWPKDETEILLTLRDGWPT
jgi:hypothetical protein